MTIGDQGLQVGWRDIWTGQDEARMRDRGRRRESEKGEELDERTSSENIRKQLISHVSIFRFRLSFKSIHLVHIYSQLDSTPHYMT